MPSFSSKRLKIQNMALFACTCCSVTDNYILDTNFYFLILFYTLHDIVTPEAENPSFVRTLSATKTR